MRHRLTEADNGTVVAAQIGDEVDLCLHGMPSSGFRWLLDDVPADLLEEVEQRFDYPEGTVGSRNEARFLFRVKAAGRGMLRLRYDRSWETGEPPLNTYQVTLEAG